MKLSLAFLVSVLSLFCMPAVAADLIVAPVLVQARHPGGAVIQLHAVDGPCSAGAKLATFIAPNGIDKVNGCYKANPDSGTVGIAWFDSDGSTIPLRVFKAPDEV